MNNLADSAVGASSESSLRHSGKMTGFVEPSYPFLKSSRLRAEQDVFAPQIQTTKKIM
jgi:hypothetical protein